MDQKNKWFKTSYLEFQIFSDINFRFSGRKSESQQKLVKKIAHFTIQFHSINLTHFTNLNSFSIVKNILPQQSQEPYFT